MEMTDKTDDAVKFEQLSGDRRDKLLRLSGAIMDVLDDNVFGNACVNGPLKRMVALPECTFKNNAQSGKYRNLPDEEYYDLLRLVEKIGNSRDFSDDFHSFYDNSIYTVDIPDLYSSLISQLVAVSKTLKKMLYCMDLEKCLYLLDALQMRRLPVPVTAESPADEVGLDDRVEKVLEDDVNDGMFIECPDSDFGE